MEVGYNQADSVKVVIGVVQIGNFFTEVDPLSLHTGENINLTIYNFSASKFNLNTIGANVCPTNINGTICKNNTGTYIIG